MSVTRPLSCCFCKSRVMCSLGYSTIGSPAPGSCCCCSCSVSLRAKTWVVIRFHAYLLTYLWVCSSQDSGCFSSPVQPSRPSCCHSPAGATARLVFTWLPLVVGKAPLVMFGNVGSTNSERRMVSNWKVSRSAVGILNMKLGFAFSMLGPYISGIMWSSRALSLVIPLKAFHISCTIDTFLWQLHPNHNNWKSRRGVDTFSQSIFEFEIRLKHDPSAQVKRQSEIETCEPAKCGSRQQTMLVASSLASGR